MQAPGGACGRTIEIMNRLSISRDWLAVLLALLAVVLVKLGVLEGVPW
jgi:hypothetical protein